MYIKNLRSNAPPKGSVKRTNKILWGDWKDQSARCVIYNNVDEAEQKSLEGASMSNDQFEQLMNKMTSIETKFNTKLDTMEARINMRIDGLETRMSSLETKVDNLIKIVKKNHPSDFN